MTSLLRMKRQIIVRARTSWIRLAASLVACLIFLAGNILHAQDAPPAHWPHFPATPLPQDAPPPVGRPVEVTVTMEPVEHAVFTGKVPGGIQQVAAQQPSGQMVARLKDRNESAFDFTVVTEPPGHDRLFSRQSEAQFFERIREESKRLPGSGRIIFPEEAPITREAFVPRQFPHMVRGVEPINVCHGRLFFEQPNFERQGWDFGYLTPLVNIGTYYYDLALLPYHAWTRPFQRTDCSAGKCLPGDSTPFYLYPEELSVTGLVGEAAVVTGLFYLFP